MNTIENTIANLSYNEILKLETLLQSVKAERKTTPKTIKEFYSEYAKFAESYYSKKYITSIKTSFQHLLGYLGESKLLEDIKLRDLENFIGELRTNNAPKGFLVYYRTLKAALNKAVDWEYILDNPFQKIQVPKVQEVKPAHLNRVDLEKALPFIENRTIALLSEAALYCGCRRSEIVNLKVKHIDFIEEEMTIGDDDFITKSRKSRTIPICDKLMTIIKQLLTNKNQEDYIFAKSNGYPYNAEYVSACFKDAIRKAELSERIHFHSLRHSFGTYLANRNVPIIIIKELMGHADINTTLRYSHTTKENLINGMNVFNEDKDSINKNSITIN